MAFMDDVNAFTFLKKYHGCNVPTTAQTIMRRQRMQLRRAEKFVLDDDAVRVICELSHEKDRLENWSFLARLPFEVCWFELNLHTKVKKFHDMKALNAIEDHYLNEVSPIIGYLMYRDDPGSQSPRWVVTQYYKLDNEVAPGLLAYVFDPEGSDYDPVKGSTYWRAKTLSMLPGISKMPVKINAGIGYVHTSVDPEILASGDLRFRGNNNTELTIPKGTSFTVSSDGKNNFYPDDESIVVGGEWARNRMAVIQDQFWPAFNPAHGRDPDLALREVREEMGHIRWLVTMLATINSVPRDLKPAQTLSGRRIVGANILPYFQHRTITLRIPNDDRIAWARKRIDSTFRNAPRPWHRVRGHWRIIERGKAPAHICRHQPTMVDAGVGMCEKCQLMIRWIADHTRGDPEIGIVNHDYKVKAK